MIAPRLAAFGLLLAASAGSADAASTVRLPAAMCSRTSDALYADGFDAIPAIPREPSNGSGGAYPGDPVRVIAVPGSATARITCTCRRPIVPARRCRCW